VSVEENKTTLRRVIDELMNGNRSIIEEAFSPNFAFRSHTHIGPPLRGLEGARVMTSGSDLAEAHVTIDDIFVGGRPGRGTMDVSRYLPRRAETRLSPAGGTLCHRGDQCLPLRRREDRRRLGSTSVLGGWYSVGMTRDLFPGFSAGPEGVRRAPPDKLRWASGSAEKTDGKSRIRPSASFPCTMRPGKDWCHRRRYLSGPGQV